jgi:type IV pilus assembly protein PilC
MFLSTTSWVLMILGALPILIGSALSYVGLIVVVIAAATFVETIVEQREAQRRSMCTLLALGMEQKGQLNSAVLLEGQTGRGIVGRAVRKLFAALDSGMSLIGAIRKYPQALPTTAVAYAAAGATTSSESSALKELSRSDSHELATVWRACIDRFAYLSTVLLIMAGVFTFLMIKIIPEFEKIFEDFDLELPAITQLAVFVSAFFAHYLAIPVFWCLLLILVSAVVVAVCYLADIPVLRSLSDGLFRARSAPDLLRILAVATESRQPVADVLARLAIVFPSAIVRRRLLPVASAVASGQIWREALYKGRFINRAELGLLGTAEQVGNVPWVLRTIAKRNQQRTVYRVAAALQVLYPCVILLLGAVVGFTVIALFLPLVKLINGLAR